MRRSDFVQGASCGGADRRIAVFECILQRRYGLFGHRSQFAQHGGGPFADVRPGVGKLIHEHRDSVPPDPCKRLRDDPLEGLSFRQQCLKFLFRLLLELRDVQIGRPQFFAELFEFLLLPLGMLPALGTLEPQLFQLLQQFRSID